MPHPVAKAVSTARLSPVISKAKRLAKEYHALTGRPLGITGEVAEFEAARALRLKLSPARTAGYDAFRIVRGRKLKYQIKGRVILPHSLPGQRVGGIKLDHSWHRVVLVILDQDFEPLEMYETTRRRIEDALKKPGSKARNERGALAVSAFKRISHRVWPPAGA